MHRLPTVLLALIFFCYACSFGTAAADTAAPMDGFIDFESGTDGANIRSTVPGLSFTTTKGYDWIYGDWRTGVYNGPYPEGNYYSNGNFFAWLGPNQGAGRIDFTQGCATYLQVWTSSFSTLYMDAYYSNGTLAGSSSVPANMDAGRMNRLRVDAPPGDCFSYVIIHDTGNYWLIDDLSTNAGGVPAQRPPVIVLPGLMGSSLWLDDTCRKESYEVWPAASRMMLDPIDSHLLHLKLADDGVHPFSNCDTVTPREVIRAIDLGLFQMEQYGPLIDYLEGVGFDVYTFPYDWRLDLSATANRLDAVINAIRTATGSSKVALVDHSLGGLLARRYVTSQRGACRQGRAGHLTWHPIPGRAEDAQGVALGRLARTGLQLADDRSTAPADRRSARAEPRRRFTRFCRRSATSASMGRVTTGWTSSC